MLIENSLEDSFRNGLISVRTFGLFFQTLRRLIARNSEPWKAGISFTITSIAAAVKSYKEKKPKFIVAVNPGFNVEEWIDLENLDDGDIPFVIVNGNIDRVSVSYSFRDHDVIHCSNVIL